MMTIDDMLSQVAKITGTALDTKSEKKSVTKTKIEEIHNKSKVLGEKASAKLSLGLSLSKEIAYCVEQAAQMMGISVVTSIVNDGGRLILLQAMDDSLIASIAASQDKAYTAAALKMPTHEALKCSRGGSLDGLTNGNGILLLGGGYPLEYGGKTVGAVGVSGGTKDQDIMLAKTAVNYFCKRIMTLS